MDTATSEIYTLSLHDALPIFNFSVTDTNSSRTSEAALWPSTYISPLSNSTPCIRKDRIRSEERFSRNAETDLVCRLLLEKKKEWHNVIVRNKAAEICENYLNKADKVSIKDQIKPPQWQTDQGIYFFF